MRQLNPIIMKQVRLLKVRDNLNKTVVDKYKDFDKLLPMIVTVYNETQGIFTYRDKNYVIYSFEYEELEKPIDETNTMDKTQLYVGREVVITNTNDALVNREYRDYVDRLTPFITTVESVDGSVPMFKIPGKNNPVKYYMVKFTVLKDMKEKETHPLYTVETQTVYTSLKGCRFSTEELAIEDSENYLLVKLRNSLVDYIQEINENGDDKAAKRIVLDQIKSIVQAGLIKDL
jgi:hypothetical protein